MRLAKQKSVNNKEKVRYRVERCLSEIRGIMWFLNHLVIDSKEFDLLKDGKYLLKL